MRARIINNRGEREREREREREKKEAGGKLRSRLLHIFVVSPSITKSFTYIQYRLHHAGHQALNPQKLIYKLHNNYENQT